MDLTFTEDEEAFRAEARAWLEANVPARVCRRATPGRASPATSSGSARCSTPAGRWCRGRSEYGGREASLMGVADLRGGVLPGGRARSGSPRTGSSCSRPRSSSSARRSSRTASSRRWPRARRRGARAGRSRTPAATSPASSPAPCATTPPAAGASPGRRRGRHAARSATGSSACSAPTRRRERHRGLTYFLVDLARRRRDRARRSSASTATRASPRCSSTTCSSPTPTCSARSNEGWRVAMATTGSERGLTLRSPGRFLATAARLIELCRDARRRPPTPRCATPSCAAGWTPRRTAGRRSGPSRASSRAGAPAPSRAW